MVHAYLMYGFPTQTARETIDSLEMVRQLFENGVIQSGFWHLFAMTAHSPVGLDPEAFGVVRVGPEPGRFANNDLFHDDPTGCDHEQFGEGLAKALFNYMHGLGFEMPLQEWFEFKVPATSIPHNFIESAITGEDVKSIRDNSMVIWLGNKPALSVYEKRKKGKRYNMAKLYFENKSQPLTIHATVEEGKWLQEVLLALTPSSPKKLTVGALKASFTSNVAADFMAMTKNQAWIALRKEGLLMI